MSDENNNWVTKIKANETIIDRTGIIVIMPFEIPPPQGNVSKIIFKPLPEKN